MNVNPMGNQAWGPNPPTTSQIIADLRRRISALESRRQFYKTTFTPGAISVGPLGLGEVSVSFPGVKVGDAVVIAYPPTLPTLEVEAIVDAENSVFVTVYNPSPVSTVNLSGTWSAFQLA
jgi:hypothetical protein